MFHVNKAGLLKGLYESMVLYKVKTCILKEYYLYFQFNLVNITCLIQTKLQHIFLEVTDTKNQHYCCCKYINPSLKSLQRYIKIQLIFCVIYIKTHYLLSMIYLMAHQLLYNKSIQCDMRKNNSSLKKLSQPPPTSKFSSKRIFLILRR